jgi:thiamine biosynthesis lipoprotein
MPVRNHSFRAMGCEIIVSGGSSTARAAIERLFHERDSIYSRFHSGSELNRVNAGGGAPVAVSAEFAEMLTLALEVARETGGLVDPTLGAELVAAGYDADFVELSQPGKPGTQAVPPRTSEPVRLRGRYVTVPPGVLLDLNGVVKGKTVDDALARLDGEGFVSAGGDLAVRGTLVAGLPKGGAVTLVRGALATSGTDRRRWVSGGAVRHHLIDPRSGSSASSPWSQVTVCGLTCLGADVAAKAAFLLGGQGPRWLDARGMPARFVSEAGEIVLNLAWQRSLGRDAACI